MKSYKKPVTEVILTDITCPNALSGNANNNSLGNGGNASDNGNPPLQVKNCYDDIWDGHDFWDE